MEEKDNAIERIKAAMEKERTMKENSKEPMKKQAENVEEATSLKDIEETVEDIDLNEFDNEDEIIADDFIAEDTEDPGRQSKAGKSFFKNNKKELAAKDQKIEELNDRLMRNMAEFDNFRKRSEKEKAQMFDIGARSIIEKMLPIVDNFERGFGTITEKEKESAFAQGIERIYKQLVSSLEEAGVAVIEAVGKEFDPNFHNAVMHGEDENLGENIISDEFQKGYIYHDTVIRHSMVKVVN